MRINRPEFVLEDDGYLRSTADLDVELELLASAVAWQQRMLAFDAAPLTAIVAEFNRFNRHQLVVADALMFRELVGVVLARIKHSQRETCRRTVGAHPADWRSTRQLLKEKYSKYDGEPRDRNGYELNTGAIIGALLYGQGDFVQTLTLAFNFGWDADCNAATAGTIVGVTKGYRWMLAQGWTIVDRYKNTTRDNIPMDETITSFADRLTNLAERVILEQGGRRLTTNGRISYQIEAQRAVCIQRLESTAVQSASLKEKLEPGIRRTIARPGSRPELARAAYLAICLGLAPSLRQAHPEQWSHALSALGDYPKVVQVIFHHSPVPLGEALRAKAAAAGLQRPATREKLW